MEAAGGASLAWFQRSNWQEKAAEATELSLKEVCFTPRCGGHACEAEVPWPSGPAENPLRIDPEGHPKVVRLLRS